MKTYKYEAFKCYHSHQNFIHKDLMEAKYNIIVYFSYNNRGYYNVL